MKLFYDTETTGLPLFKEPSSDPRQPHLVQLAALLVDNARETVAALDVIIRPDGWTIPADVVAIHGITTERAMDEGVPEREAMHRFIELWRRCNERVGHVESFDARILRIAFKRYLTAEFADEFKAGAKECTAQLARPIMKKRGAAFPGTWPTLSDAHQFFIGEPLVGAHSAFGDVIGTKAVYYAIQDGIAAANFGKGP